MYQAVGVIEIKSITLVKLNIFFIYLTIIYDTR
jgi:hypothetical protein